MIRKKILICSDAESTRESLKFILGDHYDLILVDSSEAILHALANNKDIGVFVFDTKMPKVRGLDVYKEVEIKYAKIKIIIVTADRSMKTTSGHIIKPFKSQEIIETIKGALTSTD